MARALAPLNSRTWLLVSRLRVVLFPMIIFCPVYREILLTTVTGIVSSSGYGAVIISMVIVVMVELPHYYVKLVTVKVRGMN